MVELDKVKKKSSYTKIKINAIIGHGIIYGHNINGYKYLLWM